MQVRHKGQDKRNAFSAVRKADTGLRSNGRIQNIEDLQRVLRQAEGFRIRMKRPFIIISYAQSIDGSIASKEKQQIVLSGQKSMVLTHRIRTVCDAILVGIETVLADDPRLTVRLVEGKNPQAIILDTRLRIPLTSKLIKSSDMSSWIVGAKDNSKNRIDELTRAGATIFPCAIGPNGKIDLHALMRMLTGAGVNSLMVEGGSRVITSFINAGLVDQFMITISPKLVGGLQVIDHSGIKSGACLRLVHTHYQHLDEDLIMWATPLWEKA